MLISQGVLCSISHTLYNAQCSDEDEAVTCTYPLTHAVVSTEGCLCLWLDNFVSSATSWF
jgi:hypothetical protein